MELFIGGVLRMQDPTVDLAPRERIDHASARREIPPSKQHHALGLRVNCTHTREEAGAIIGAVLAREHQRKLIIPGPRLAKVLESSVGVGPRHNLIVSSIPPVDLPDHRREVLFGRGSSHRWTLAAPLTATPSGEPTGTAPEIRTRTPA
jgi:hypothetical protein